MESQRSYVFLRKPFQGGGGGGVGRRRDRKKRKNWFLKEQPTGERTSDSGRAACGSSPWRKESSKDRKVSEEREGSTNSRGAGKRDPQVKGGNLKKGTIRKNGQEGATKGRNEK